MKTPITITLLTTMLVLGLAGCGSNEPRKEITTVSVGQQLIDLQKAFDSGAISKDEYERLRLRIMRRD